MFAGRGAPFWPGSLVAEQRLRLSQTESSILSLGLHALFFLGLASPPISVLPSRKGGGGREIEPARPEGGPTLNPRSLYIRKNYALCDHHHVGGYRHPGDDVDCVRPKRTTRTSHEGRSDCGKDQSSIWGYRDWERARSHHSVAGKCSTLPCVPQRSWLGERATCLQRELCTRRPAALCSLTRTPVLSRDS
jgi:hypothetical protein